MRITIEEKLKMCEEHVLNGKSLSHVSELYDGYSISNLKYLINLLISAFPPNSNSCQSFIRFIWLA